MTSLSIRGSSTGLWSVTIETPYRAFWFGGCRSAMEAQLAGDRFLLALGRG